MDTDGKYGSKGEVSDSILHLLYEKAVRLDGKNYFTMKPPKSLDIGNLMRIPELDALSLEDACATLEAFTADTIVHSLTCFQQTLPKFWVLAGGGWNNPVIRNSLHKKLKEKLGKEVRVMTAD